MCKKMKRGMQFQFLHAPLLKYYDCHARLKTQCQSADCMPYLITSAIRVRS